jgi:hypothetical protein
MKKLSPGWLRYKGNARLNLRLSLLAGLCLLICRPARAEVQVFIEPGNGPALLKYRCTAGEVLRAFALDVSVDHGAIIGISNFFKGPSTASGCGYGIFPASFRDHIQVLSGTNVDWSAAGYTPLASTNDLPGATLPGLNSPGVTLEFGALWDPLNPSAVPEASGTLCSLDLSQAAQVTVTTNGARGGVVSATPGISVVSSFTGAFVDPVVPRITGISLTQGTITISFIGGELVTAATLGSAWVGTGQTNGIYIESVASGATKFYRVLHH